MPVEKTEDDVVGDPIPLEALREFLLRNDPQPTQPHVFWEPAATGRQ